MAQRVEPPNPLQEAYACLLSNGLDGSGFYPSALERGSRSEQSVNLALAEMYVHGVSIRKVIEVLQKPVGSEVSISSTQISR